MKSYIFILLSILSVLAVSCEYDNYDAPNAQLTGKIVYQGEPLGLSTGEVTFQLYEPGWQLTAPINVNVAQDGSYSALLFNGTYKLIIPKNQGPFMNISNGGSDTIVVNLNGKTTKDIEVMPYYMVRNPQFTANAGAVTATFKAEKILTDANAKNIEKVWLLINKTTLVDERADYNIASASKNGSDITDPNAISLSVNVPTIVPTQNYVFARVAIKMAGVEKLIFSPVQKLSI